MSKMPVDTFARFKVSAGMKREQRKASRGGGKSLELKQSTEEKDVRGWGYVRCLYQRCRLLLYRSAPQFVLQSYTTAPVHLQRLDCSDTRFTDYLTEREICTRADFHMTLSLEIREGGIDLKALKSAVRYRKQGASVGGEILQSSTDGAPLRIPLNSELMLFPQLEPTPFQPSLVDLP